MRADLHAFERHLAARHLPRTVAIYTGIAARFLAFLGSSEPPSPSDVEGFLARLRKGAPPSTRTRNLEIAALRSFGAFAVRDLGWPSSPAKEVPFAREARRDPRVLSGPEIRRLFTCAADAAGEPFLHARALAALALLTQDGLRVSEVSGLDLDRVDLEAAVIFIRRKGDAWQELPLNAPTLALVRAWLGERAARAKPGEKSLFVSLQGGRWSIRSVQRLLERLRAPFGRYLSPRLMRHSAATAMVASGVPVPDVADALGHASIETTMLYVHLADGQARVRRAVERLESYIPSGLAVPRVMEAPRDGATARPLRPENRQRALDAQEGLCDAYVSIAALEGGRLFVRETTVAASLATRLQPPRVRLHFAG